MQTQSIQPLTQAISIMRSDENITTTSRGMLVLQIMEKVEQAAEGKSAELIFLIFALCESLRAIIRLVLPVPAHVTSCSSYLWKAFHRLRFDKERRNSGCSCLSRIATATRSNDKRYAKG